MIFKIVVKIFVKIFKTFFFINVHLISITIFVLLIFFINHQQWFFLFFSSFELTFFQQYSQYQISNLVKKLMKMNENIVILKRDTKNILHKFSKMKKRISFLKRRIITNKSQLKRFFSSFLFHSFLDFFFDFLFLFTWSRFIIIIIIISYVFSFIILYVSSFIITFVFFRNSYTLFRSLVRSSTRSFASLSSKELIAFAFKAINEKTNELFNKFDFIHEIMNESIKWLKNNFVL